MSRHIQRFITGAPVVVVAALATAATIWVADELGLITLLFYATIVFLVCCLCYCVGGLMESVREWRSGQ